MKTTRTTNPLPALCRQYNAILARLDREARRDRCKGDICCGWDWPTLRIVQPETYARLKEIAATHNSELRALRSAGLLAPVAKEASK